MKKTANTETVVTKSTKIRVGLHYERTGPKTDYRCIKLDREQIERLLASIGNAREVFLNAFYDGDITAFLGDK